MMDPDEKGDGRARQCRVGGGHRVHSVYVQRPQQDFKQGRDMIQFTFLKGKSIPIQTLPQAT